MPQRSPTPSEISAALAALGVYAQAPSDAELAEQAIAAGGENVLAAVLANALYGAAIGCGMLAEGVMLEQPTDRTRRLSLARAQALKASGAEGPGFVGAMHWQAAHIAGPLRALKDREQAPLGQALAAVSWALVLLLQAMCLAEPAGSTAVEVTEALADARAELSRAEAHLRRLDQQTAGLADELRGVIAAAQDAMDTRGNGHSR
jgi:signal transduction histidine kinase